MRYIIFYFFAICASFGLKAQCYTVIWDSPYFILNKIEGSLITPLDSTSSLLMTSYAFDRNILRLTFVDFDGIELRTFKMTDEGFQPYEHFTLDRKFLDKNMICHIIATSFGYYVDYIDGNGFVLETFEKTLLVK